MRIHATLLPFSTAQFATLDGNLPPALANAAAQPGAVAAPAPALTVSEQAAFAGLLALAVNPKDAPDSEAADDTKPEDNASDDSKVDGTQADVTKPDSSAPITTSSDLTNITSALHASMIVRDLGALQPQFRAKVERVISRMNDEYGHTVLGNPDTCATGYEIRYLLTGALPRPRTVCQQHAAPFAG